jgi:hypothetical protein
MISGPSNDRCGEHDGRACGEEPPPHVRARPLGAMVANIGHGQTLLHAACLGRGSTNTTTESTAPRWHRWHGRRHWQRRSLSSRGPASRACQATTTPGLVGQ